jgi:hypothetical protein
MTADQLIVLFYVFSIVSLTLITKSRTMGRSSGLVLIGDRSVPFVRHDQD